MVSPHTVVIPAQGEPVGAAQERPPVAGRGEAAPAAGRREFWARRARGLEALQLHARHK